MGAAPTSWTFCALSRPVYGVKNGSIETGCPSFLSSYFFFPQARPPSRVANGRGMKQQPVTRPCCLSRSTLKPITRAFFPPLFLFFTRIYSALRSPPRSLRHPPWVRIVLDTFAALTQTLILCFPGRCSQRRSRLGLGSFVSGLATLSEPPPARPYFPRTLSIHGAPVSSHSLGHADATRPHPLSVPRTSVLPLVSNTP